VTGLQRGRALTRCSCRGGRRGAVVHYPLGACDVSQCPSTNHSYVEWTPTAVAPPRDALNAVACNLVIGFVCFQLLDLGTRTRTAGLVQANACGSASIAEGVDRIPQVFPRHVAGGTCKNVCWDIDCPSLDLNLSFSWHLSHQETQPTLTHE
jgi:hypothetical protein